MAADTTSGYSNCYYVVGTWMALAAALTAMAAGCLALYTTFWTEEWKSNFETQAKKNQVVDRRVITFLAIGLVHFYFFFFCCFVSIFTLLLLLFFVLFIFILKKISKENLSFFLVDFYILNYCFFWDLCELFCCFLFIVVCPFVAAGLTNGSRQFRWIFKLLLSRGQLVGFDSSCYCFSRCLLVALSHLRSQCRSSERNGNSNRCSNRYWRRHYSRLNGRSRDPDHPHNRHQKFFFCSKSSSSSSSARF